MLMYMLYKSTETLIKQCILTYTLGVAGSSLSFNVVGKGRSGAHGGGP